MRTKIAAVGITTLLMVPFADRASAESADPVDAPALVETDEDDDDGGGAWGLLGLLGLAGLAGLFGRRRTTDYVAPSSIVAAPRTAHGASTTDTIRGDDY